MDKSMKWETAKEFIDQASGAVVQVQKKGRYFGSPRIGHYGPNGFVPYPKTLKKVENGVVTYRVYGMVYARLLDEAGLYIQESLQQEEDFNIMRRADKEQRAIDRETGTQNTARTGKTAREREAGKLTRHENNIAARRSTDQERTSASKSGKALR